MYRLIILGSSIITVPLLCFNVAVMFRASPPSNSLPMMFLTLKVTFTVVDVLEEKRTG